jgi:site-specific DNA recombinase
LQWIKCNLNDSSDKKLGKDVKRGLEKKVSLGWRPGVAPEGYINDMRLEKGQRTIITDRKRSVLLRKAFDLMLTGNYSAPKVLNLLNDDWCYITRKKKKSGGGPLSRSAWYKILSSPFYAGIIVYNGLESKGKHKPLITIDEFNRIQEILGQRGCKRRPQRHDFTYAGMFKCNFCGCGITAEHKTKYIKSEQIVRGYDYYHCTHKKKEIHCRQGSVEETQITDETNKILEKLALHPLFLEWSLEYLDTQKESQKNEQKVIEKSQENKIKEIEDQLSELTMMRIKKLIDDNDFLKQKNTLKKELEKINKPDKDQPKNEDTLKLTKETFIFCAYALKQFNEGNKTTKKEVLSNLGSNRVIEDKKVLISVNKWLLPIYNQAENYNAKLARLEPTKHPLNKRKNDALTSLRLSWLRGWDSNPRPIG